MGAAPQSEPDDEASGLQIIAAIERSVKSAIARSEKSVVAIARVRAQAFDQPTTVPRSSDFAPSQFGTGVIIDERGLILTNYHVLGELDGSQYFVTTIDRQTLPAEIKATDPRSDLAVLKVHNAAPSAKFTPIQFGDAKTLEKGSFVIALGNPYAIARDGQPSASWGMVSNLLRKVAVAPNTDQRTKDLQRETLHYLGWLIQTDAKLNLGTSGGALVNLKGEMIGLTTSLAAVAGYEQAAGYAIPVDDTFRWIVQQLKEGREAEYGFLGIEIEDAVRHDAQNHKMPAAAVRRVVPGTPAFDAGLRRADIITAVNGEPVHDRDHLMFLLGKLPAEALTRLTIERRGQPINRTAFLAKFWVQQPKIVSLPPPSWRGLHVDYTTATPARDRTAEGQVIVIQVDSDSPAAKQGLTTGMIITHVDGTSVRSPRQFRTVVAARSDAVTLTVRPDSNPFGSSEQRVIEPKRN